MDKPISLSVKDYIIRKMAVKLMMSEKAIDAVITHKFSSANEAMRDNKSVEISGFGKFVFNQKKANQRMEKMLSQKAYFESLLQDPQISEQKKASTQTKLTNVINNIEVLKPKIEHENQSV
jgi:nucleoid DNA-binding protein